MKYILILCLSFTQAFAQVKVTIGVGGGGGGADQTFQEVLTTGAILTGDNTVDMNSNGLTFLDGRFGIGAAANSLFRVGQGISSFLVVDPANNLYELGDINGINNSSYLSIQDVGQVSELRAMTRIDLSTGLLKWNSDTVATRDYARSVGGGGAAQTFQQVLTTGSTLTGDNTVAGGGFAYNHLNSKIFLSSPNNNYIDFEDAGGEMTLGANAGNLILSSNDSIKTINPLYTDEIYIATAKRLRLGTNASDLTSPVNGDMFYNTGTNKFRGYENGEWVDMIGGGGNLNVQSAGGGESIWYTSGDTLYLKSINAATTETDSSLTTSGGGGGDMVLASIQTVTGAKTFNTGKLILAGSTSGTAILNATAIAGTPTLTLPTVTGTIVQYVAGTTASSATPTPTGDARENYYDITALAANATFSAPSGTAANHNKLRIRITDNGTIRTLAWNAIYDEGADVPLPTATVAGETMFIDFDYNIAVSKWQIVGKTGGF